MVLCSAQVPLHLFPLKKFQILGPVPPLIFFKLGHISDLDKGTENATPMQPSAVLRNVSLQMKLKPSVPLPN